jgi:hypothetical protein
MYSCQLFSFVLTHGNTELACRFLPNDYMLLTVIVNETHVVFYKDLDIMGVKEMSRPITDCGNNQAGILAGDAGLELGQLRFYPRTLTAADIQEIYAFGSTLADISTVLSFSFGFLCALRSVVYLHLMSHAPAHPFSLDKCGCGGRCWGSQQDNPF